MEVVCVLGYEGSGFGGFFLIIVFFVSAVAVLVIGAWLICDIFCVLLVSGKLFLPGDMFTCGCPCCALRNGFCRVPALCAGSVVGSRGGFFIICSVVILLL